MDRPPALLNAILQRLGEALIARLVRKANVVEPNTANRDRSLTTSKARTSNHFAYTGAVLARPSKRSIAADAPGAADIAPASSLALAV
jgi:hypothetical protein